MKVMDSTENLRDFMQCVAIKKDNLKEWMFFHAAIHDPERKLRVDEIEQFMDFHIQSDNAALLKMVSTNELLLFVHQKHSLALSKFEKAAYENFADGALQLQFRGFENDGMEKFCSIIAPHLQPGDATDSIIFKRMGRRANSFLIMDDDVIVLKQAEKILSGYGNVVTMEEEDKFFENYEQYAPDVLFLDIHLKSSKGNEILKDLKDRIDPFAHVIMISSDTQKEIVVDIKLGGAKGFVVKPLNRDKIFQQIMKVPTIMTKANM